MKKILVMLVLVFFAVNVSAITSNVTIVSDEVYTGAILKLKNLDSEKLGDSHYPYFIGKNIGIIKFEIETGLSKANFNLRFTNHSEICLNIEKGPFVINGSDIFIDLRKLEEISIDKPIKNQSAPANLSDSARVSSDNNVSGGVSEEITSKTNENKIGLEGYVSKNLDFVQNNIYVIFVFSILFAGIFLFFIVQKAYKSGAKGAVELLGRMEMDKKIDKLDDK